MRPEVSSPADGCHQCEACGMTAITVTPRVVAGADVWHLIVDSCPYCGKQHRHGGYVLLDRAATDTSW